MSKKEELLTEQCRSKISQAVKSLEARSSIELLPVFLKRASNYALEKKLVLLFFVLLLFLLREVLAIWQVEIPLIVFYIYLFASLAALIWLRIKPNSFDFLLKLISKTFKQQAVESRAREIFVEQEVFSTEHRSGVLLVVSEVEKEVYILVDKAFDKVRNNQYWAELASLLAQFYNQKTSVDVFIEAIEKLGDELSQSFPFLPDQKNELGDEVIEESNRRS